jgi:hypothetical protein
MTAVDHVAILAALPEPKPRTEMKWTGSEVTGWAWRCRCGRLTDAERAEVHPDEQGAAERAVDHWHGHEQVR